MPDNTAVAINIVVGAASGMGAAVAQRLALRGPLIVADRDSANAEELANSLGDHVQAVECDVTNVDQIANLASRVEHLGALVVTAGLSPTMASGRPIFEVNLIGMARVLRALEPSIGAQTAAVCFASIAGHAVPDMPDAFAVLDDPLDSAFFDSLAATGLEVDDSQTAYSFSKRGVIRLVRNLAGAWGAKGARILSLSPGIIDTPMGRLEDANQPFMATMVKTSPLARTASADEIAAVVDFLTSSGASYMTGSDVLVDGGMVAVTPVPGQV
jgi:NAD(P)-dependent dehydrogenase (short-subunit alcohol dehydrogenase family)